MAEQVFPWAASVPAIVDRAARWREAGQVGGSADTPDANLLAGIAGDPSQREFVNRLVEVLFGTEDAFAAANGLRDASQNIPDSMPMKDRLLLRASGTVSFGLPWLVKPLARRHLLGRASELIATVRVTAPTKTNPAKFTGVTELLRAITDDGLEPVVTLLGDTIHGNAGTATEVQRLLALIEHAAVHQVAIDPGRLVARARGGEWAIDADAALAIAALEPLAEAAVDHDVTLTLEPTDLAWVRVLPTIVRGVLGNEDAKRLRFGVRLPSDLPESRELYAELHCFAQSHVAKGGVPLEVVIGQSQVAARERIRSILTGLAVPVIEDQVEADAQFLRLIELVLHPGRAAVIRPVIATEDARIAAAAVEVAEVQESTALYSFRLRSGVEPQLAQELRAHADVQLHLPLLPRGEHAGAIDVLVGYIAEFAAADLATDPDAAFLESADLAQLPAPASHRTQHRAREWDPSERDSALFYKAPDETTRFDTGGLTAAVLGLNHQETGEITLEEFAPARTIPAVSASGFANEPLTDACVAANRTWVRELLVRSASVTAGTEAADATIALSAADLDPAAAAAAARESAAQWASQSHSIRAVRLRRAGLATAAARDRIFTELAAATGAPARVLDAQVNLIIDAARYAAQQAEALQTMRGATFVPDRLVLVFGDEQASLGVQSGAVLAALAAGSGVLWAVPAALVFPAQACIEEWEAGGLTPGAIRVVGLSVEETLAALGASPMVDRAVVFGRRSLGRELARHRPDLRVEGHFVSGSSMLITPTAEIDRAVTDLVDSAFRADGSSLASMNRAILLGSVGRSKAFRESLADAVRSLRVGDVARPAAGTDPLAYDVGPLTVAPSTAGLRALTELGRGEEWLVEPRLLSEDGRLWSPGVRIGVSPKSQFWVDAVGMPVLGISTSSMLSEAISQQNALGTGAAAGIQSWDAREIETWLEEVSAASLMLNRPIGSHVIERQPRGGWDDSVMGLPVLSGGPHWLVGQGSWTRRRGTRSDTLHLRGLDPEIGRLIELLQADISYESFDELRRAALDDQLTWRTDLGVVQDEIGLGIERNVRRAWPVAVQVRLAQGGSVVGLTRVLAAAFLARSPIEVSTGEVLPGELLAFLDAQGIDVSRETDDDWLARIAVSGPTAGEGIAADRVRLIGGDRVRVAEWMGGLDRAALWAEPVTMAGPVELLVFLREQAISARAERHGLAHEVPGLDELLS
ncbi:aldehyde dehydrogenase family protein [Leucobacter sp. cx-42]|uniref:proline dehydrogenase family protein n=1 Tax=unclassified Leucobacter TaxID=2621730 RepID=UPI00165D9F39|nr:MULTISPECIES: proline dehydrogenase family protein [unclassified Leucobacter]MBC9954165.1 aldehyde dehydrogenase family protein [Leucobacter sp. cx-42]